jgi:hypothetical protein
MFVGFRSCNTGPFVTVTSFLNDVQRQRLCPASVYVHFAGMRDYPPFCRHAVGMRNSNASGQSSAQVSERTRAVLP